MWFKMFFPLVYETRETAERHIFGCGCEYRATNDEITCVARCERHADRKVEA